MKINWEKGRRTVSQLELIVVKVGYKYVLFLVSVLGYVSLWTRTNMIVKDEIFSETSSTNIEIPGSTIYMVRWFSISFPLIPVSYTHLTLPTKA